MIPGVIAQRSIALRASVANAAGIGAAFGRAPVNSIAAAMGVGAANAVAAKIWGAIAYSTGIGAAIAITGPVPGIASAAGVGTAVANSTDPKQIFGSNLIAWYSADRQVFSDNGFTAANNLELVAQWNDLSGNSNHVAQTNAFNRPTLLSAGLNGNPTISFGANGGLFSASNVPWSGNKAAAFAVMQMLSGTAQYGRLLDYLGFGQTTDYHNSPSFNCQRDSSTNGLQGLHNGYATPTAAIVLGDTHRLGIEFNGTYGLIYLENVLQGPSNTITDVGNFGPTGTIGIGGDSSNQPSGGPAWNGQISEVIFVQGTITSTQRQQLDDYLRIHWQAPPVAVVGAAAGTGSAGGVGQALSTVGVGSAAGSGSSHFVGSSPGQNYTAEDGTTNYTAEDGTTVYVSE
jgi:hypothetical protein